MIKVPRLTGIQIPRSEILLYSAWGFLLKDKLAKLADPYASKREQNPVLYLEASVI